MAAPIEALTEREDSVPQSPWPVLPKEEEEIGELIASKVRALRGSEPASVAHEERLADDVQTALSQMIESPQNSGLPIATLNELSSNPEFRAKIVRAAIILASHLYPLSLLLYGYALENITCLGHDFWLVSTVGRKHAFVGNSPFGSDEEVLEFFRRAIRLRGVTGDQSITDADPIAEANLGSVIRLMVAKRPAVSGKTAIKASVRVPSRSRVQELSDYITGGIMPAGAAEFMEACVKGRCNILIAGGTSTGKTTLMRIFCSMTQESDHIVVIEDGAELHLDQDRGDGSAWHQLTSAVSTIPSVRAESESTSLTMFDLVRHSLRLQPDRIILGESRGEEMAAVCKALMTGHDGSMSTIHAESCDLAIDQAVQYVMENPRFAGNEKMAQRVVEQAFHVVIHLANQEGRRRLTGILAIERGGNHKWVYRQNDVGGWDRMTEIVGNLNRIQRRIRPYLRSDEVPAP